MVLPILVVRLALPDLMVGGFTGLHILLLLFFVFQTLGTGAMIRVVMQEYLDRPISFGEAFQFALSRFVPLIGTSLLSGILIFLGYVACFIPGIYLAIALSLASQVVIVEDKGGMDALSRSRDLIKGHFGRVFGILFLVGLIAGVVNGAIGVMGAVAFPFQEVVRAEGPFETVRVSNYGNYALITTLETLV
jgi:hypothetical protein